MDSSWLFNLGADIYGWFTAQRAWRSSCARLASRLADLDEPRIADLGCGPGVSTFELARRLPRAHVFGLDVAPRMLRQARARQLDATTDGSGGLRADAATHAEIGWLRANAASLPFTAHSLDACTGHSFLYLVSDRDGVLAEVLRVLKPGGRLVLMEPNARAASVAQTLRLSRDPRHLVSVSLWRPFSRLHGRFTPASLVATLEHAGFVESEAEETFGGLGILASAQARP